MKAAILCLALLVSFQSLANTVVSTRKNKINVARIDKVINLVDRPGMKVNVVVEDLGGSTDVSPTQRLLFTVYSKGEMFSTDATFDLGLVYEVISAKRISGGIYEIKAVIPVDNESMMKTTTFKIDAIKVVNAIQKIRCEEFDCEASQKFQSEIFVITK